jgi:Spy/CpxP family protein refolding chaperone
MPVTAWSQRQAIYDWTRLRNYQPSADVVGLADAAGMTDKARRLFYISHPQIIGDKPTFQSHCTDSEKTIVLGCYINRNGIYLYNVTDTRLNGVKEVTAAHEMLHAAYDRLTPEERQRIDNLTTDVFRNLKDERLQKTIESYRQKDPSVVPNELHSILGTEVGILPKDLEDYYAQYFQSRLNLVKLSETYEKAFTEREDKVASYDKQLQQLKQTIETNQAALNSKQQAIESERAQLDSLLKAKRYDEYNALVPDYNAKVRSYNSIVNETQALIDQYNQLVKERNAIVLEEKELFKAIDSRPTTIPSK